MIYQLTFVQLCSFKNFLKLFLKLLTQIRPCRGDFLLKINKCACTSIRYTRVLMCLISFTMNSKSSSKVTLHRKTAKLQKTSLGGKSLLDYVHFNAMVFHYLLLYFMQSQFQCLQKQRKEVLSSL